MTALPHTDFDAVDPAEHLSRSAAAMRAMEDSLARAGHTMEDRFHRDVLWRGNVGCSTKRGLGEFRRNWLGPIRAAFADRTHTTERFLADAEGAGGFGVLEGTHVGALMGLPAMGRRVRIPYMDFWRVEDGRIADNPVFVDFPAVCLQLGRDVFAGEGWEAYDRGDCPAPPDPTRPA